MFKQLLCLCIVSFVFAEVDTEAQYRKDIGAKLYLFDPDNMQKASDFSESLVAPGESYSDCKVVRFKIARCKAKFPKHYKFVIDKIKCQNALPWCNVWDMCDEYNKLQCNAVLGSNLDDLPESLNELPKILSHYK